MLELDRAAGVDEIARTRAVGDRRGEVEHLEHALERHERGKDVDARVRELREWVVDLAHVDRERDDRAGRERAGDREVTADEVYDRGADRGHQAEGDEQDASEDRGAHSDVAHAGRAPCEGVALTFGPAEQLRDQRARDVEALDGEVVHLGVELHPLAGEVLHARPHAPGRPDEQGQDRERQQGEAPLEAEHDREDDRDVDDVRDDRSQGRGDRLLRADDVVVQAGLQRAGLRTREESDRHALHVVEERHPQVVDQALAHAR